MKNRMAKIVSVQAMSTDNHPMDRYSDDNSEEYTQEFEKLADSNNRQNQNSMQA